MPFLLHSSTGNPTSPHLTSHYQPLTTKAFMKIEVLTTGVATP